MHLRALEVAQRPGNWGTVVDRRVIGQPKGQLGATGCKAGDRNVLTETDLMKVGRLLGWKPVADVRVTDFSQPDTLWDNGS